MVTRRLQMAGVLVLLGTLELPVWAENGAADKIPESGSTAFCLFEVPSEDGVRRRWVNLGIVQYVEVGSGEVRLVFGGGNLGSGHEARIPMASKDEGVAFVDRLRKVAGECRQSRAG